MLGIESIPTTRIVPVPARERSVRTPPEFTPSYRRGYDNESRQRAYQLIGQTLMICEAGSLQVGIPWLPPSRRVRALARQLDGGCREFVRQSLVTASTHVLESYCDDLESLPEDPASSEVLFIPAPTYLERHAFPVLLGFLSFALTFLVAFYVIRSITLASIFAAFAAVFSVLVGGILCEERSRRVSFYNLLMHEILRRSGTDGGRVSLRVMSPQMK